MRIIFVSPNRLLHNQWNKAVHANNNIYEKNEIENFLFLKEDIVLFDLDNFEEFLDLVIVSNVLCLSSKIDNIKAFRLLKKGVKAYGNTYMTPMNLKNAIDTVKENKIWVHPELMSFIIQNSTLTSNKVLEDEKLDELSPRELEVSKLVAKGLTNKQIAQELDITERTVKAHISSIFNKFDIQDRVTLGIMIKESLN